MIPMPPGVFVRSVSSEIRLAEKPRSFFRYRFWNADAGATNRFRSTRVTGEARVGVRCFVPAALFQSAAHARHEEQPEQRHHVDEAPPSDAEVGERQRDDTSAGAERSRHGEEADRIGTRAGRHLLDRDDRNQDPERHRKRARDGLRHREPRE
jgi:hypothetical protein